MTIPSCSLSSGRSMPMLGFGVFKINTQPEMTNAVSWALESGYRLFDTARMYGNEELLGHTLSGAGIRREEYFLTSKLHPDDSGDLLGAFHRSLDLLQTDYLDLFMIHWPGQQKERLLRLWHQLESLQRHGYIRSLGVCNCTGTHLGWILENCTVPPAVHQVEHHPFLQETELYDQCRSHDIQLQAWAPLIRGNLDQPVLEEMAFRYEKSAAQLLLRWNIQQGFCVIPKSSHRERIAQNADIFDFQLSASDMAILNKMHIGMRTGKDPFSYDY